MHHYTIHFSSWNRTTRRMSGRRLDTVKAVNRFGALRVWWRTQRQFQPMVEVHDITLNHMGCPRVQLTTHVALTCGYH